MSDGSGLDFGTIRSRAFSEHGRQEYDRIFRKVAESIVGDSIETAKEEALKEMERDYKQSKSGFIPQQHEQMR